MKPIPSNVSKEVIDILNKAQELEKRIEQVKKAQPEYNVTFNTKPEGLGFVSETAGQTRSAYYTTNQHLLDSDDVANKGATTTSVNLEKLGGQMNPHEGSGVDRLDDGGSKSSNSPQ